ncbi:MAG TPA: hypothetical protein VLT61_00565 [Anaeromyxobacteraceae bacterium]|nr:hypothetical protein [Anaeromyxobacteraceae bacterium]
MSESSSTGDKAKKPPPTTDAVRGYQELWFALARRSWSSVVLVPAAPGGSTVDAARALAEVGGQLDAAPVTALTATALEYGTARALSELNRSGPAERDATGRGRLVIAISSVITEPLGLGATAAADAVIVCIEQGRTRLADARRTIELVGRDRIAGCYLVT